MAEKYKVTPVGFLGVVPLIPPLVFTVISRLVTYPFRTIRHPSLHRDVLYGALRCLLTRMTIPQARFLSPPTSERYAARCRRLKIEPKTVQIDTTTGKVNAHWVGDPDAEAVVLFLHGGGYTQSATEGQFQNLEMLIENAKSEQNSRSLAFLFLAYSLAPEATHPTPLREAVSTLSYLLSTGRKPSNILISGDSSGGGIAIGILSHLLHPHKAVSPIKIEQPLGGVLVYSPWVGFNTDYPSYRENATLDMLPPTALRRWAAMLLGKCNPANREADPGPVSGDAWTETCLNPSSWWNGLPGVVGDIFVAYGGSEVFASPIRELGIHMKEGWTESGGEANRVIFFEGVKEAHIAPIVDIMNRGVSKKSDTQKAIDEWLKARLQK